MIAATTYVRTYNSTGDHQQSQVTLALSLCVQVYFESSQGCTVQRTRSLYTNTTRTKRWAMRHHFPYVRMYLRNLRVQNIRAFCMECLRLSKRLFAATCDGVPRNSAEKCKFFMSCTYLCQCTYRQRTVGTAGCCGRSWAVNLISALREDEAKHFESPITLTP